MLGILTNYFAPAIVVEEGSKFYKRSGITASLLHIMSLLILFLLTLGNVINTCFHIEANAGFITYFVLLVLGLKLPKVESSAFAFVCLERSIFQTFWKPDFGTRFLFFKLGI